MANPTEFIWIAPTKNTDGSAVVAGELGGYNIGIRSTTKAGSVAGTYPIIEPVAGGATLSEALAALPTPLSPDSYAAAIQAVATAPYLSSDWSTPEVIFTLAAPKLEPPSGFSVA